MTRGIQCFRREKAISYSKHTHTFFKRSFFHGILQTLRETKQQLGSQVISYINFQHKPVVPLQSTMLSSINYLGEILQVSRTYGSREGTALCSQKGPWGTSGRNHGSVIHRQYHRVLEFSPQNMAVISLNNCKANVILLT